MVEVGSIQIGGSIQTEGIERGLKRVEGGFKDIDRVGKGVNSDFQRMSSQAQSLGRTLGAMALVGSGALIALAKGAPATAGAMAKIEVGTMKLKFAVGDALKEEFNWFADKLNWLSGWVGSHPDLFGNLTKGVLILAGVFTAFKVGGLVLGGLSSMAGTLGVIWAILSSPTFLVGLAALTTAAATWAYVHGLASQAQEFSALAPGGMQDIQYSAQTETGTRQFESSGMTYSIDMQKAFSDYNKNKGNISTETYAWDDIR